MNVKEARKILGVRPDCSRQEIKEAYAVLSKQFHPEEHPEEFQKIHDAYVTLTRRRGRGDERTGSGAAFPSKSEASKGEERTPSSGSEASKREERTPLSGSEWSGREKDMAEESSDAEPDFERVLKENERAETRKRHEKTQAALKELENIFVSGRRHQWKAFQEYFALPDCREVFMTPEFIKGFNGFLLQYPLKPGIYDGMIDVYRLRGLDPGQLFPEAAELYDILDQKRGMGTKKKENAFLGIPAGIAAGIWAGCRPVIRDFPILQIIMLAVFAILFAALVYKKMYENHSRTMSLLAAGAVLAVLATCLIAAVLL